MFIVKFFGLIKSKPLICLIVKQHPYQTFQYAKSFLSGVAEGGILK